MLLSRATYISKCIHVHHFFSNCPPWVFNPQPCICKLHALPTELHSDCCYWGRAHLLVCPNAPWGRHRTLTRVCLRLQVTDKQTCYISLWNAGQSGLLYYSFHVWQPEGRHLDELHEINTVGHSQTPEVDGSDPSSSLFFPLSLSRSLSLSLSLSLCMGGSEWGGECVLVCWRFW